MDIYKAYELVKNNKFSEAKPIIKSIFSEKINKTLQDKGFKKISLQTDEE